MVIYFINYFLENKALHDSTPFSKLLLTYLLFRVTRISRGYIIIYLITLYTLHYMMLHKQHLQCNLYIFSVCC